jgi:hypothetical protein
MASLPRSSTRPLSKPPRRCSTNSPKHRHTAKNPRRMAASAAIERPLQSRADDHGKRSRGSGKGQQYALGSTRLNGSIAPIPDLPALAALTRGVGPEATIRASDFGRTEHSGHAASPHVQRNNLRCGFAGKRCCCLCDAADHPPGDDRLNVALTNLLRLEAGQNWVKDPPSRQGGSGRMPSKRALASVHPETLSFWNRCRNSDL